MDVLDQRGLASCVANAGMQAVRANHVKQGMQSPKLGSRLFGYYTSRAYHHETNLDNGTFLRTFFAALNKFGFCPEEVWSYTDDAETFKRMPPTAAFRAAFDQVSPTVYRRIYEDGAARIDAVKRAIAAGYCVCFGTDVSTAFAGNQLGEAPLPPPVGEPIAGGHAMCVAGYDGDVFDVVNSWSAAWGANGWCRFSADYVTWTGTRDLWIVEHSPKYSEAT